MDAIHIEEIEDPGDDLRESVNVLLRTHNQACNPRLWEGRAKPENEPQSLNLFALAADRGVIGGLFATTEFSWLRVNIMATREELRGRGIGKALLARAEAIARERGCKHAFADTMDYQAPGFYQAAGYKAAGEIPDWDSFGHTKFFFTKEL